jgi:hypothetical protein
MPELVAHAYDAAAWRFHRPPHNLNFPEVESIEEAELLAPPPHLRTNDDRHRQAQRRLVIAKRDERLMQQWWEQFPDDV